MIVQTFLRWSETASASDRAKAAGILARAFVTGGIAPEETLAAEAAMALLLEDPSPKVRLALAEQLAPSSRAPRTVILALASDQVEVASHVVALSPLLSDGDLVDLVAQGRSILQQIVAFRRPLGVTVSAAIAEVGSQAAVSDLLDNPEARIARISIARIAERFGENADIRSQLLDRPDLACSVRQVLVEKLGAALAGNSLVQSLIGGERVRRVTEEACLNATLKLAETVSHAELPALIEHLRISGRLTPAFLMHALCSGQVDFFAAAVVSLSGVADTRVRGLLVDGREAAIRALYRSIGLDGDLAPVFVTATLLWREAARRREGADQGSVAGAVVARHATDAQRSPAVGDLLRIVETMHHAWRRQMSRDYAAALAAEAA